MIIVAVFHQTHSVKVLIVQPVHICVGIVRITCSTVDLTTFHHPQIRDYINIMLSDI
jgi:hypothetical protein